MEMQCPSCGVLNPSINNFCRQCGARLEAISGQATVGSEPLTSQGEPAAAVAPRPLPLGPQNPSWEDAFWGPMPEATSARGTVSPLLSRAWQALSVNRRLAGSVAAVAAALTGAILLMVLLASPAPREALSSSQGVDYLSLARAQISSGNYRSAIDLLQARLQENPRDTTALALLDEARRQEGTQPVTVEPAEQTTDPALAATVERMFGGLSAPSKAPTTASSRGYSSGIVRQGTPVGGPVEALIPPPLLDNYSPASYSLGWEAPRGEPVPDIPLMPGPGRTWLQRPGQLPPTGIGVIPLGPSAPRQVPPLPADVVSPPSHQPTPQPVPGPVVAVHPPTSEEAAAEGNFTPAPALTIRPATNFLGQARAHQARAQQLRRENRLEAARSEYRAAINSCRAAIEAGELKAEADSILSACDAGLRSLEFSKQ